MPLQGPARADRRAPGLPRPGAAGQRGAPPFHTPERVVARRHLGCLDSQDVVQGR